MTIAVSATAFALGSVLGALIAWARIEGNRPLQIAADAYVTVLRGIPDLLVIYLLYFGGSQALTAIAHVLGAKGFVGVNSFAAGAIAVGAISGAYQSEIFRGAYHAIARGELEAARSVGMSRPLLFRRIIVPQALRFAIPGLGNVWQLALKESALISVVGPDRDPAPGDGRRRLDAPAVRVLHHGGGALSRALHDFGRRRSSARKPSACAACAGVDGGSRLSARNRPAAALRGAAAPAAGVLLDRRGRALRRAARADAPFGQSAARLRGAKLRLRVPRHAAPRADLSHLLRARPVPRDPAELPLALPAGALLVRAARPHAQHRGVQQRDHPRRNPVGALRPDRGRQGMRNVAFAHLPPHHRAAGSHRRASRLRQRNHPDDALDGARFGDHADGSDRHRVQDHRRDVSRGRSLRLRRRDLPHPELCDLAGDRAPRAAALAAAASAGAVRGVPEPAR